MRHRPRRLCAFVAALALFAACTPTVGLSGGIPEADGGTNGDACGASVADDHDNCGACGHACGALEYCRAGACAPGCPAKVVYVSPGGSDDASGCSPTTPKKTLNGSIAFVRTLGAEGHALHVCRGTFAENVRLDYPLSILGGYECTTWQRTPGFGAPTFDGVNETVVTGEANSPTVPVLDVARVAGVTVDGVTVVGKSEPGSWSVAAVVRDGATATLSNDRVRGGTSASSPTSPASVALRVETSATVEVRSSRVEGGGGFTTGGYGSVGVFLAEGAGGLHLVDSRVSGGAGAVDTGTGSVGVLAFGGNLGKGAGIERSFVEGGTGKVGVGSATYGVSVSGTGDVDVIASAIDAGSGTCNTSGCATTGLAVFTSGAVRLLGNRIGGGELDASDCNFVGLTMSHALTADVENNMIWSGNAKARVTASANATVIKDVGTLTFAQNTVVLGTSYDKSEVVAVDAKSSTFYDNLFAAQGPKVQAGVHFATCTPHVVPAFRGNAWAGIDAPLVTIDRPGNAGCTTAGLSATTVSGVDLAMANAFGGAPSSDNVRFALSCGVDNGARCMAIAACAAPVGCLTELFSGWDPAAAGGLFTTGWKLREGAPCLVVRGGVDLATLVTTDHFGAPRSLPRSIGAHEQDGSCKAP